MFDREGCEKKILDALEKVRDVILEYGLGNHTVNISANDKYVSVFVFAKDENDEPKIERDENGKCVSAEYLLDRTRYLEDV